MIDYWPTFRREACGSPARRVYFGIRFKVFENARAAALQRMDGMHQGFDSPWSGALKSCNEIYEHESICKI